MVDKAKVLYMFGEFSLDPDGRSFRKDDEEIHLPAKEFDTLLYFIENQGRVLTKDEMMSAIWEDTFVEEGNLAQYVSRLRKLLGSNGHSYIQTLPKKGYRFDADIETVTIPTAKRVRFRPSVAGLSFAVGILIVAAALILWTYRSNPRSTTATSRSDPAAPAALTDGKQDDGAVQWTSDNRIRFFHRISPNRMEAWVMNLDGTDQRRETPPIKDFLNGMWSPDGKKIFFMKEGDGKTTYLANADGSGEIALPMLVGNSDWSPDSTKFVYETKVSEGNTEIYLYDVQSHQNVNLSRNPYFDADPSFTPDGKHVVFLSGMDGNAEIYMMDLDGNLERRLTNHPAFDNFPSVSPDGTQLLFFSNRDGGDSHMYIRDLDDDSPPIRVTDFPGMQGTHAKCWSPDGTQIVFTSDVNGKDQIYLLNIEPFRPRQILADGDADLQFPRISPNGARLLYQARLADHSIELRIRELDSGRTRTIYKSVAGLPVSFMLTAAWSPLGDQIVFDSKEGENSQLFVMKADGSEVHAVTDGANPDFSPVFSSDGKEIFFARDFYGKSRIYRMNVDGSDQRPLTNKADYELSPMESPDGHTMLYSADRLDGRAMGLDIYSADLSNIGSEKLLVSRPMHEVYPVFSPDAKRIAFAASSDDNFEIYMANADGSGLVRLTRNKANDSSPTFSADGKKIIFSSDRSGKFALYEIDLPF